KRSGSVVSGALPLPYADAKTTNGCSMIGLRDAAAGPRSVESFGGARQPSPLNPSGFVMSSNCLFDSCTVSSSGLKNRLPTAYCPKGGSLISVSRSKFLMKNLCGIEVMTPAPSPSRASEPTAPRGDMLQSKFRAEKGDY